MLQSQSPSDQKIDSLFIMKLECIKHAHISNSRTMILCMTADLHFYQFKIDLKHS